MAHATQTIEMSCSPQQLLSVITDFGSYPQFLPEIVETRIVSEAELSLLNIGATTRGETEHAI